MKPIDERFVSREIRFTIPPSLIRVFAQDPRIILKERPDGILVFPIDMLAQIDWKEVAAEVGPETQVVMMFE